MRSSWKFHFPNIYLATICHHGHLVYSSSWEAGMCRPQWSKYVGSSSDSILNLISLLYSEDELGYNIDQVNGRGVILLGTIVSSSPSCTITNMDLFRPVGLPLHPWFGPHVPGPPPRQRTEPGITPRVYVLDEGDVLFVFQRPFHSFIIIMVCSKTVGSMKSVTWRPSPTIGQIFHSTRSTHSDKFSRSFDNILNISVRTRSAARIFQ